MASSVDGDIRLSVGLDTSNIEQQLKGLLGSLGKNAAKIVGDNATKGFTDMGKSAQVAEKQINSTNKAINSVANNAQKSANSTDGFFKRIWNGYSTALHSLFDFSKQGQDAIDGVNAKAEQSESKIAKVAARVANTVRSALGNITGMNNADVSGTTEQEKATDRVIQKEKELGNVAQETTTKMAQGSSKATAKEMSLDLQIEKTKQRLAELTQKMEKIGATEVPTEAYKNLQKDIDKAEKTLLSLIEKSSKLEDSGKSVPKELTRQIDEADEHLKHLEADMERLKQSGKAFTPGTETGAYAKAKQDVENTARSLEILNARQNQVPKTASKAASRTHFHFKNAFNKIKGAGGRMVGHIKNMFSRVKDKAKGSANDMEKSFRRGFRNILKYALGIRSFYLLFRKIRAAAKEALTAMATQFPEVNAQLSALKNSFIQLKGAVGTMVQPLLQALAPALTTIINLFSQALNVVGSFFALLTGQNYIYKAKKGTTSFASAQDASTKATKKNTKALKENQEQLGHYDKLNIIDQKNKDSGAGGGGGGGADAGAGTMTFEKVPVESWIKDFADRIKKAWKKADFTEIGEMLGTKLRDALNKIPWKKIQTTAEKIGKSLGTLLAGFISVPGLAKSIGNTIGQALNTVLLGIRTFVKNVPWYKFGKFVADGLNAAFTVKDKNGTTLIGNIAKTFVAILNAAISAFSGFVKNVKWKKIGQEIAKWLKWAIKNIKFKQFMGALGDLVNGIVDLIYEIVSDETTWKELGTKIGEGISNFFHTVNWKKFGTTISNSIKGILDAIIAALDALDWDAVGKAISDFISSIDWWGIFTRVVKVIVKAFWGAFKALFLQPPQSVGEAIIKGIGLLFVAKKFTGLIKTISTMFSGILGKGLTQGAAAATGAEAATGIAGKLTSLLGKVGKYAGLLTAAAAIGWEIGSAIAGAINKMEDQFYKDLEKMAEAAAKDMRKKLDSVIKKTTSVAEWRKDLEKVSSNIKDAFKKVENSTVVRTMEKLGKKTHLTKEETQKLKEAGQKLCKKYPEYKKFFNKTTGLIDTQKIAVKNLLDHYEYMEDVKIAKRSKSKLQESLENLKENAKGFREEAQKAKEEYDKVAKINQTAMKNWDTSLFGQLFGGAKNKTAQILATVTSAQMKESSSIYGKAQTELSKTETSINSVTDQLNDLITLINNPKISAKKWEEVGQKMENALSGTKLKDKVKKNIVNVLQDMVKKGKISWDQYEKLANGSYKKVDDLYKALDKINKKDVKAKVKAVINGEKKLKDLQEWFKKANGTKTITFKTIYRSQIQDPVLKAAAKAGNLTGDFLRYYWMNGKKTYTGKKTGGIFTQSGWHDVQGYAKGGLPKSGQFFMARENGIPELVGSIRNHTAVMNNNQIVASVANGVYRAVAGVAQAILPYVRSQTHAMNWLAQNGLQLPEIPKITLGNVIPNNSQFLNAITGDSASGSTTIIDYDAMARAFREAQSNEPIVIQMPNGKVLAEVVWDEEEKKYNQTRSSTLRTKFA